MALTITKRSDGSSCPDCGVHKSKSAVFSFNCKYSKQNDMRGKTNGIACNSSVDKKLLKSELELLLIIENGFVFRIVSVCHARVSCRRACISCTFEQVPASDS